METTPSYYSSTGMSQLDRFFFTYFQKSREFFVNDDSTNLLYSLEHFFDSNLNQARIEENLLSLDKLELDLYIT